MSRRRFVLLETVWIPLGGIASAMLMRAVFGQPLVAAWAARHDDEWGPQRRPRS